MWPCCFMREHWSFIWNQFPFVNEYLIIQMPVHVKIGIRNEVDNLSPFNIPSEYIGTSTLYCTNLQHYKANSSIVICVVLWRPLDALMFKYLWVNHPLLILLWVVASLIQLFFPVSISYGYQTRGSDAAI